MRRSDLPRNIRKLLLIGAAIVALTSFSMACPVCFGAKDSAVSEAIVPAIGVLMGCTGIVAAGIGGFAARLAFRNKQRKIDGSSPLSSQGR